MIVDDYSKATWVYLMQENYKLGVDYGFLQCGVEPIWTLYQDCENWQ